MTLLLAWSVPCQAEQTTLDPAELAGLHGGLIVQLGADNTEAAAMLSRTGRYLIHVLDSDADTVATAQKRLRQDGHYGLAWAEKLTDPHGFLMPRMW